MATGWTDAESDQLTALHAEGRSLHSIASDMGRSKRTISKWAEHLGLSFDRTRTAKAAEAVHVDNKAKRATLESRLLDEAANMLDELHRPALVYSFGGPENLYSEHELDKPTFSDQKAIVQTAATAIQSANRLHELNTDHKDLPAVDAWLRSMLGGER